MPGRAMATRRRHVQARRVRRFEMERPSVAAVLNEGAVWTTVNAQRVPGLVLAFASLVTLIYLFASPQFFVYDTQVTGNQRLSIEQVYRASGTDMTSIFFIAPRALEAQLLAGLPRLREVRVALNLPARVQVHVVEKQARYVWEAGGQSYLADEQGVVIGTGEAPADALRIRVTEGEAPSEGQPLDAAVLETASRLSDVLGTRSLEYSPRQGLAWRTEQGWPAYFGVGGEPAQKVAVMRTLAADLAAKAIVPQFLDVSVAGRPYYR